VMRPRGPTRGWWSWRRMRAAAEDVFGTTWVATRYHEQVPVAQLQVVTNRLETATPADRRCSHRTLFRRLGHADGTLPARQMAALAWDTPHLAEPAQGGGAPRGSPWRAESVPQHDSFVGGISARAARPGLCGGDKHRPGVPLCGRSSTSGCRRWSPNWPISRWT
jgi:hypothetical protein